MAPQFEPFLSDKQNLSITRTAEEHAIDFLLNEGRSGTFHAREEKTQTGKNAADVVVTVDGGTHYKYRQVESQDTYLRLDGVHTSQQINKTFMSGLFSATTFNTGQTGIFDLHSIPLIPADMKFTASSSTAHADGNDWGSTFNCASPRYGKETNCTGMFLNPAGQVIAKARAVVGNDGNSKMQLFTTKGHYLGEINEVTIKDPTGNVTTTDITARR